MVAPSVGVKVIGLRELVRDLGRMDREIPRQLRAEQRAIANDVAAEAKTRAASLGGVHRHVSPGIGAGATSSRAYVSLNVGRQPAILGAEFGGGARPRTRQFPPWRGSGGNAGYMVYPTLYAMGPEIERRVETMLENIFND